MSCDHANKCSLLVYVATFSNSTVLLIVDLLQHVILIIINPPLLFVATFSNSTVDSSLLQHVIIIINPPFVMCCNTNVNGLKYILQ